jgi:putative phage-type endonuclease
MTATVVLERASRARWLARRRKGITATDVPALLGLSPWRTPLSVWLDKVAPEDRTPSYPMRRGHALEQVIAEDWAARHAGILEKPPMLVGHPEHRVLLASLDWLGHTRDESAVLECKTATQWDEWADGDLPDTYAAQALTQAAITGLPVIMVADVNGRIEERRIERQPDWEAEAFPLLLDWWDRHVVAGTPPPIDPLDYHLLNRVWRPDPAEEVEANAAVMGAVGAFVRLREVAKEREHTMTGLKSQIRAHMGTATRLTHHETGAKVAAIDSRGALLVSWKPNTEEGNPA